MALLIGACRRPGVLPGVLPVSPPVILTTAEGDEDCLHFTAAETKAQSSGATGPKPPGKSRD